MEEILRNLQEREQALERASQELENARVELEQAKQELAERSGAEQAAAEALVRRERDLASRSREAIEAAVRQAREAISDIVREAKRAGSPQGVAAARVALAKQAKEATASLPEPPPLDLAKLRAALADRSLGSDKRRGKPAAPTAPAEPAPAAMQSRATTLDLRGQRADEALGELEAFLDRTALEGADTVYVIHGHGTGALRKVVREYLATSAYVAAFRAGGVGEGGDGVSVVSLRG
jgi:DNA mismatch repair protein MutS2